MGKRRKPRPTYYGIYEKTPHSRKSYLVSFALSKSGAYKILKKIKQREKYTYGTTREYKNKTNISEVLTTNKAKVVLPFFFWRL